MRPVMNLGLVRNDFSFEAAKTLSSLFDQPDFSDVTLVCEDQKQILGHKVILASGSPFFKNILSLNPHPQLLIYLRVKSSDLQAIVNFIYTGQCKVAQNELDEFLEIAKSLEIVGIFNDEGLKVTKISNDLDHENVNDETNAHISKNFERKEHTDIQEGCDQISTDEKNNSMAIKEGTDNLFEIKGEPKENTEKAVGLYCNECKLTFPTDPHLKEHINRDHLFCCDKIFSSMKSLNCHKWVHSTKSKIQDQGWVNPETDEHLIFFKSGRREENHAYDKNFFSFG